MGLLMDSRAFSSLQHLIPAAAGLLCRLRGKVIDLLSIRLKSSKAGEEYSVYFGHGEKVERAREMPRRDLATRAAKATRKFVLIALLSLLAAVSGSPDSHEIASSDHAKQYATTVPEGGFIVDRFDRDAVISFYRDVYLPGESAVFEWNGNGDSCTPGTTSFEFHQATADRINYYRAMAGVPADIVLHSTLNAMCEQAALMMDMEGVLTHEPSTDFFCYTEDGATAAGKSNLSSGSVGPAAIDTYISDIGDSNTPVGHRRWILNPPTRIMGSGNSFRANALWVLPSRMPLELPPRTADSGTSSGCFLPDSSQISQPVAWPPDGFVPKQFLLALHGRWSFSYRRADFSQAMVSVSCEGEVLQVEAHEPHDGYGLNTLVWEVTLREIEIETPGPDITYSIRIDNVIVAGESQTITYDIVAINIPGEN